MRLSDRCKEITQLSLAYTGVDTMKATIIASRLPALEWIVFPMGIGSQPASTADNLNRIEAPVLWGQPC